MPPSTLRKALTSYLDLASTPSQDIIQDWIQYTSDDTGMIVLSARGRFTVFHFGSNGIIFEG